MATVTKSEICRSYGWTRYRFDQHVRLGMPIVEAAPHKGGQWRIDPEAVARWLEGRQWRARKRALELECLVQRRTEAAREAERRKREVAARREAEYREQQERRRLERALERCYSHAKRLAYRDYSDDCARRGVEGPVGPDWPARHPRFLADWPSTRPDGWQPPPGMLEVVLAEPACRPYGYQEPDWTRWVPPYVPGQPWPWRNDDAA